MISLITATLGRINEVERLLNSLSKQTFKDFEIIIVDQNDHLELKKIVSKFTNLNLVYIRSSQKGLSLNRNIGLSKAKGDIIGFPDDDCYYDSKLLESVINTFKNDKDCVLVAVNAKDTETEDVFLDFSGQRIVRSQLLKRCISYNFFMRRKNNMQFDIRLGVGAAFGSGEETDFLWEYFSIEDYGLFCSGAFVHHPHNQSYTNVKRALTYGKGMGAIFKKEIVYRHHFRAIFTFLKMLTRSLVGLIIRPEKTFFYNTFWGRITGFFSYKI